MSFFRLVPAWSALLFFALGSTCLVSCGGDDEVAETEGQGRRGKAKSKSKAGTEDVDDRPSLDGAPIDESSYTYNPIGKRDPFRSFIANRQEQEIRSPTPLQQYEIEQLELVGIVWGIDQPRALIQDPQRVSHVVERGTYIGRNWGKVTEITSRAVVITEEYQTIEGELVTEQVIMDLPIEDDF